jgi:hypothetical protein
MRDDVLGEACFMSTHEMYFPFFTSECVTAGLEIADRQNAHSMGLAVLAIVTIFQLANKRMELHRRILTFSVSHSHRAVRIYGWYPIMDGESFSVYRHTLRAFDLIDREGTEKWTTYRFSMGVYRYALGLLGEINAVIDALPPNLSPDSLHDPKILQLG